MDTGHLNGKGAKNLKGRSTFSHVVNIGTLSGINNKTNFLLDNHKAKAWSILAVIMLFSVSQKSL